MESYKPNFESLDSVVKKLDAELGFYQNAKEYFNNFAGILRKDEEFQKNFDQLSITSRAFVKDSTVEDDTSMKSFLIGGLFGYNSLNTLGIENLYDQTYTAVGAFMAKARMKSNKHIELEEDNDVSESFRNYLISEEINKCLKEDLSFEAIDEYEASLVYKTLHEITGNEDYTEFAFRGYSFIRGILLWHERHKIELIKQYLRSVNESEVNNDRNFFEIISDVEINPDLSDGKEECDKELLIVNSYFKRLKSQYRPKSDMDDDKLHDIITEMESDIMRLLYTFEDLTLFNRFTFEGPNMVLIADDRTEFTRFKTFGVDSILEGTLVDIEIRAIPNQYALNRILKAQKDGDSEGMKIKLNHFGLVFQLQDAVVIDYDGSVTTFPKHSNIFVPVEFKDTRILRHLYEDEDFQDTNESDNYDEDDD